jgi:hypothetical protein
MCGFWCLLHLNPNTINFNCSGWGYTSYRCTISDHMLFFFSYLNSLTPLTNTKCSCEGDAMYHVSNFNFHYNGLFLFGALCVGVELKQAGFIFVLFLVFSS